MKRHWCDFHSATSDGFCPVYLVWTFVSVFDIVTKTNTMVFDLICPMRFGAIKILPKNMSGVFWELYTGRDRRFFIYICKRLLSLIINPTAVSNRRVKELFSTRWVEAGIQEIQFVSKFMDADKVAGRNVLPSNPHNGTRRARMNAMLVVPLAQIVLDSDDCSVPSIWQTWTVPDCDVFYVFHSTHHNVCTVQY